MKYGLPLLAAPLVLCLSSLSLPIRGTYVTWIILNSYSGLEHEANTYLYSLRDLT